uniref:Uncharacterized protein n=1 Tax=Oryza sativa subsp. japonica TaxID=39947 RepID=Q6Z7T7_ORYSJ|nr:hypothetical protein [Oryza sativa Japonica Group]
MDRLVALTDVSLEANIAEWHPLEPTSNYGVRRTLSSTDSYPDPRGGGTGGETHLSSVGRIPQ